jgi:polyisoprenoid-binding protein YceI
MHLPHLLTDDHERLSRRFQSIVTEAFRGDPIDLREAWRDFERDVLHHLDAEDEHLLRAFGDDRPDEARALMAEHAAIRDELTQLGLDVDLHCLGPERVQRFADELGALARREEALLHPWAERELGEMAQAEIRLALAGQRPDDAPARRRSEWRIDPDRSTLRFSLRHIIVHEIRGSFTRWGGGLSLDETDPNRSAVRVWVDLASIDTGEPSRDDHVRSPEFFDVERFPRAHFASSAIVTPAGEPPTVRGMLDLHGVRREVTLQVTERRPAADAEGPDGPARLIFTVKGRLDRREFGLRWNQDLDAGGIVLGDEIVVAAHIEAVAVDREAAAPPGEP